MGDEKGAERVNVVAEWYQNRTKRLRDCCTLKSRIFSQKNEQKGEKKSKGFINFLKYGSGLSIHELISWPYS